MVLASLALGAGTFYYYRQNVRNTIAVNRRDVQFQLQKQLTTLNILLDNVISKVDSHINITLPRCINTINTEIKKVNGISNISKEKLAEFANYYRYENIFLYDKNGFVKGSLDVDGESFSVYKIYKTEVSSILGQGAYKKYCLPVSRKITSLKIFSYFSPKGSDYIIEVIVDIRHNNGIVSKPLTNHLFYDLFDVIKGKIYVSNVHIFGFDDEKYWSILYGDEKIDSEAFEKIKAEGKYSIFNDEDSHFTEYTVIDRKSNNKLFSKVEYDFSSMHYELGEAQIKFILMLLLSIGITFLFFSLFLNKYIINRIIKINNSLNKISKGDYTDKIVGKYSDELFQIIKNIEVMKKRIMSREKELRESKGLLEERVTERTEELNEKVKELGVSEQYIHSLLQQIMNSQEIQMHEISRELHDNMAQDLSSLNILCSRIFTNIEKKNGGSKEEHTHILNIIKKVLQGIRDLSYSLHPSSLEQLAFSKCISELCNDFTERNDFTVSFQCIGVDELKLDFTYKINMFRIIQEALNNIRKYANCEDVIIKLTASHPDVLLRIEDNGDGFDAEARIKEAISERRMGVRGMWERVDLLKGSFKLKSIIGKGTNIFIKIPLNGE